MRLGDHELEFQLILSSHRGQDAWRLYQTVNKPDPGGFCRDYCSLGPLGFQGLLGGGEGDHDLTPSQYPESSQKFWFAIAKRVSELNLLSTDSNGLRGRGEYVGTGLSVYLTGELFCCDLLLDELCGKRRNRGGRPAWQLPTVGPIVETPIDLFARMRKIQRLCTFLAEIERNFGPPVASCLSGPDVQLAKRLQTTVDDAGLLANIFLAGWLREPFAAGLSVKVFGEESISSAGHQPAADYFMVQLITRALRDEEAVPRGGDALAAICTALSYDAAKCGQLLKTIVGQGLCWENQQNAIRFVKYVLREVPEELGDWKLIVFK
jgi:hypothetical protein